MYYILKGHNFIDDIVSILMLFYPNDKYTQTEDIKDGITLLSGLEDNRAYAELYIDGELKAEHSEAAESSDRREIKRVLGLCSALALKRVRNIPLAWGILTGVRPAKLVSEAWSEGLGTDEIRRIFTRKYLVSPEKLELMIRVAEQEKNIVENGIGKISIYIGIPFCPTRCLYCSFTSYPLERYRNRVDEYIDALIKEMSFVSGYVSKNEVESLYIGGGTPTSLNEKQLERLLCAVEKYLKIPAEFTAEAGRPDTVTPEKLRILKEHNVSRISINPQTLNDDTLRLIGREHTSAQFFEAFELARKAGHEHINTDIILGLPGEGEKEVTRTMQGLEKLSPESITVHTLAVKRASRLKETLESYDMADYSLMERLIGISREYTEKMGMLPYYMYRQKNMAGNFENVGWCKEKCQCIYNVAIMEEKQTVIALGAGGSTKIVDTDTNRIERIFNVKSVDDYITRIDEMLERKKALEGML